jgi:hypothetical protein
VHGRGVGGDVDDAGAFAEVLERCLGHQQGAKNIHVERPAILVLGDVLEHHDVPDAGVVDHHVEAPELFDRGVDQSLGLVGLGDVTAHGDGFAAGGGDRLHRSVSAFLARGVVHHHSRTRRGERLGDRGADPLGTTGDDGDFSCELRHVDLFLWAMLLVVVVAVVAGLDSSIALSSSLRVVMRCGHVPPTAFSLCSDG